MVRLFGTIRRKIIAIFILCVGFTGLLTGLYSWQVLKLKEKFFTLERFHSLFEDILEVRRYEKNLMYFREEGSLREIFSYLEGIHRDTNELRPVIVSIMGQEKYDQFKANLLLYRTKIEACIRECGKVELLELRNLGKSMVNFAQTLLQLKKKRINRALQEILFLPTVSIGGFVILTVFLFYSLARNILYRLSFLQKATQEVAKGDFTPIPNPPRNKDEITQLIDAFNKMAAELESRWEQLVESRKLASIGTFTSGIAHELNNPLNNISLTAELLLEDYNSLSEGEAKEMILDIINQASRAGEVVKNLLDFSKTRAPSMAKLSVKDVIQKTINLIKNQIMIVGVKLDVKIPQDIPPIRGNMQNLQQVFLNLLLNAIQAMPDGGKISIEARNTEDGYVAVDVSDTGVGIKPEALEKIFDPFYTTKPAGRGTGLGLSIVYGIIKKHGGRVEVKSKLNEGTTFTVYIPTFHGVREDNGAQSKKRDKKAGR